MDPEPRLTEGEWKLPTTGNWWFDGHDGPVDYPVTMGRIVSNAGSSIKSLMAETAQVNGKFPAQQEAFNNFAGPYLDQIWPSIHGVEGGGYMYGGLQPGDWNDGAHGVTTVSKTDPDLHYVHVLTKPADRRRRISVRRQRLPGHPRDRLPHRQAAAVHPARRLPHHQRHHRAGTPTTRCSWCTPPAGSAFYPTGVVSATATASADGFPAAEPHRRRLPELLGLNATLPVSVTLDLGQRRPVQYLAVNQREWSPTYNRNTFGRPEDSARIKDYKVFASNDGVHWGDPVKTGVMPSARGVQYLDLGLTEQRPRYVKLEVDDTWAADNAPRFFHQLQIDEMWLGWGYPTSASAGLGHRVRGGGRHGARVRAHGRL